MRPIDLAPLIEQRDDRRALVGEQAMHRTGTGPNHRGHTTVRGPLSWHHVLVRGLPYVRDTGLLFPRVRLPRGARDNASPP